MLQDFFRDVRLFRDLEDDDLAHLLMVGMVRQYPQGAVVLREGAPGGNLSVVHYGQVRVSKIVPGLGEEALTILVPGDFFGEVEFLDGAPASASVIAHTDCEIFSIPHGDIRTLMREKPELSARLLWTLGQTLSQRLRETNRKVVTLINLSRVF